MRPTSVEQHGVTITFSQEDCALLAYLLNVAYLHKGRRLDRMLLGQWLDAAMTVFEAGALLCDAGGTILDSVLKVMPEDQAGLSVGAIRRRAEALAAPGPRLED